MRGKYIILLIISLLFISTCYKADSEENRVYEYHIMYFEKGTIENDIFNIINQKRIENNLKPLVLDIKTQEIAKERGLQMQYDGIASHDGFSKQTMILLNLGADQVGENVGYGYATALGVCNAWFNSPEHLRNILNSGYDWCGISVTKDTITQRNYYCQFFGGDNEIN